MKNKLLLLALLAFPAHGAERPYRIALMFGDEATLDGSGNIFHPVTIMCSGQCSQLGPDLAAALDKLPKQAIAPKKPFTNAHKVEAFDYKSACGQDDCGKETP